MKQRHLVSEPLTYLYFKDFSQRHPDGALNMLHLLLLLASLVQIQSDITCHVVVSGREKQQSVSDVTITLSLTNIHHSVCPLPCAKTHSEC